MTRKFTVSVSVDAGRTGSNHLIEGTNLAKIIEQTCDYLGSLDEANERTLADVVRDIIKAKDCEDNYSFDMFATAREEFRRGWDRKSTGFRLSEAMKEIHDNEMYLYQSESGHLVNVLLNEYFNAQSAYAPKNAPKGYIPVYKNEYHIEDYNLAENFERLEAEAEDRIKAFKSSKASAHIGKVDNSDADIVGIDEEVPYEQRVGDEERFLKVQLDLVKNGMSKEQAYDRAVEILGYYGKKQDNSDADIVGIDESEKHFKDADAPNFFKDCKEEIRTKFKGFGADIL